MSGMLDLSGADASGFDAIPAGSYNAEIFEVEHTEVRNEGGRLPVGTPGWNVSFRITDGEYEDRRQWKKYWIVPDKIDGKKNDKKAKSDGMIVRFLTEIGYDETEVTSGKFEPDFEDMQGRECEIRVRIRHYDGEPTNDVVSVRARGKGGSGSELI